MSPKIKSDPKITSAARSTAKILLVTAVAKAAISKCLATTKVWRKPLSPMTELTTFLITRDATFPLKMNGQVLFAVGEGLEKIIGDRKKPELAQDVAQSVAESQPEPIPEETETVSEDVIETAAEQPAEEPIVEETSAEEPVMEEAPIEEPVDEETSEETPLAEEPVEEATEPEVAAEETQPAEEPVAGESEATEGEAVEAMAPIAVAETTDEETEDGDEPAFASGGNLEYIDVMDEPAAYAALLAQAEAGEVQLVTRYRRSYQSRLIQSKDPMQDYYSGIKNALLAYKGVKSRISWANEKFHQGRNHIAHLIVKTSSLYVYLAVDPETLKGTKYESAVTVLSGKKKFETVPVLIKIKGERKYKYALELIEMICKDNLQLPLNKKYVETDYKRPAQSDDELVELGLVRKLVAGAPLES